MTRRLGGHQAVWRGQEMAFSLPTFPVMDQGKLVGIVSLGDLVRAQRDHYEGQVVTLETLLSD